MLEVYAKINSEQTKLPDFSLFVDDVCNDFKKANLQTIIKNNLVIYKIIINVNFNV